MRTYEERRALIFELFTDPELHLTAKEVFVYTYHWYRYELALRKRAKGNRNVRKYGIMLNTDVQAFALRKSINNL